MHHYETKENKLIDLTLLLRSDPHHHWLLTLPLLPPKDAALTLPTLLLYAPSQCACVDGGVDINS